MPSSFNAIDLSGLTSDTLGSYLAAIGLIATASRRWRQVRGCWRNDVLCLVGGPTDLAELEVFLRRIAERGEWSLYSKAWDASQKTDRGKLPLTTARWRSADASEKLLPLFQAHIAAADKLRFNPLLGTGGNAGKRDFAKGWKKATQTLKTPPRGWSREALNDDLHAFLVGSVCHCLGDFNAGCWFSAASKIYNSGTKKAFREGQITPWAMALACEGLPFFSGGPTRQLGSQTRTAGAFPFVTTGVAPKSEREAGRVVGEVWLPIWDRPMTRAELFALFQRGRAELEGRGATTPAAFSAAIIQRGVDSGIVEFRRCLLMRTTSENTFESQVAVLMPVRRTVERDLAEATRVAVALRDALPSDRKEGRRWKFVGLRGPLEEALIDLAAAETQEQSAEKSWALVDAIFAALAKVDRNRAHRARNLRFELLPSSWAARLFAIQPPGREARLALGVASLRSQSGTVAEFLAYRLGVIGNARFWSMPETPPTRRVWGGVSVVNDLCTVCQRRLVEFGIGGGVNESPPFDSWMPTALTDVHAWLLRDVDEAQLQLWLDRFCLFHWDKTAAAVLHTLLPNTSPPPADGALALYTFFRPLFDGAVFRRILKAARVPEPRPALGALGRIAALLGRGDVDVAVDVARGAYHSAGIVLADFHPGFYVADPTRLLASLIFPARASQIIPNFEHWQMPTKAQPTER